MPVPLGEEEVVSVPKAIWADWSSSLAIGIKRLTTYCLSLVLLGLLRVSLLCLELFNDFYAWPYLRSFIGNQDPRYYTLN